MNTLKYFFIGLLAVAVSAMLAIGTLSYAVAILY